MTNFLLFIPIAMVLVTIQATLMKSLNIAGINPDLVLVSILILTMISGRRTTILATVIVAPLFDAISGLPLGTTVLPLLSVVFIAGIGERSLFGARLGWPIAVAIVATLVAGSITMAELSLFGWQIPWTDRILRVLVPSAIVNALLVLALYIPAEYLRDRRLLSLGK